MVLPCLGMGIGLALLLAGCKETILACENFVGPHVWHNRKPSRRMLNSSSTKVVASEGPRRYPPHFVWPFAPRMDLGECKAPVCASGLEYLDWYVEGLNDARTLHGKRRVPGQGGCLSSLRVEGEVAAWVGQERKADFSAS